MVGEPGVQSGIATTDLARASDSSNSLRPQAESSHDEMAMAACMRVMKYTDPVSSSVRWLALLAIALLHVGCGGEAERNTTPEGLRVLDARLGMDCMPVYPPDSSRVGIEVEYSNSSDVEQTWTLEDSRVEFSKKGEHATMSFRFAPDTSGSVFPGEHLVIHHEKPPRSVTGVHTCVYCPDGRWELFVSWTAPDGTHVEQRVGTGDVGCTS
jgi:hypothetical protein